MTVSPVSLSSTIKSPLRKLKNDELSAAREKKKEAPSYFCIHQWTLNIYLPRSLPSNNEKEYHMLKMSYSDMMEFNKFTVVFRGVATNF